MNLATLSAYTSARQHWRAFSVWMLPKKLDTSHTCLCQNGDMSESDMEQENIRKPVAFFKRCFDVELDIPRFVEKAIGGLATLVFTLGLGIATSIAGSDPTPAIYWITGAGSCAVIAVFLFDDVKELQRWKRIGIIVLVGVVAVIGVTYGDGWASDKAVIAAEEKEKRIAAEGAAEAKRIRSEFERRRAAAANPLKFSTLVSGGNYVPRTAINGIPWHSFFTELDLMVVNPTDNNYSDVDILVRPDFPVAQIKQSSALPNVSFEDFFGLTAQTTVENVDTKETLLMVPLATDAGYRVHCSLIPPRQSLRLILVLVDFKKGIIVAKPGQPIPIQGEITPDRLQGIYTFATKDGIKGNYWFGNARNSSFYNPRPEPQKISISGNYTVEGVRLNVKEEVSIPKPQSLNPAPAPILIIEHPPNRGIKK